MWASIAYRRAQALMLLALPALITACALLTGAVLMILGGAVAMALVHRAPASSSFPSRRG